MWSIYFTLKNNRYLIHLIVDSNFLNDFLLSDIPEDFHSDLEQNIFCDCTFCGDNLLKGEVSYMIEKSFKVNPNNNKRNTVFEYAICMDCNTRKMKAMSAESVSNIQQYMANNFLLEGLNDHVDDESDPFAKCLVTGTPIEELEEYNIVGHFIGDKMISGQFPILISPSIGEEIQELLSQQTKDEFDDFMSTITNVPPELKALFKTKRPVFV
jgi:hypothetical protein